MKHLTVAEILFLHHMLVKKAGGAPGIRDLGLLQSAAARPFAGFAGKSPSAFDKAAVLAHSIIANHPFVDGNKRTGIVAAGISLRINSSLLKLPQEEMVAFTLRIARGEADWPEISGWLKQYCVKAD